MADKLSKERRSWNMSRIRGSDTGPERSARSILHRMGYRFTVNGPGNRKLPGRPDIVLPKHKAVVFVHGCFWHRHPGCRAAATPKTNAEFWRQKLDANAMRDRRNERKLRRLGWKVCTVWECQLKSAESRSRVTTRLHRFLRK